MSQLPQSFRDSNKDKDKDSNSRAALQHKEGCHPLNREEALQCRRLGQRPQEE